MILRASDPDSLIDYYAYKIMEDLEDLPRNKKSRAKKDKKKNRIYKNVIGTFDIEATNLPEIEQSFMYIWQFDLFTTKHHIILGRTWDQFLYLLRSLSKRMEENRYIQIFIHNASYEFFFLAGVHHFETEDVFCLNTRKIGKFDMLNHFEFRCSFVLTNLKLSQFCKDMRTKHRKLDGERFDYSRLRTPSQDLKRYEIKYCIEDVRALAECIRAKMDQYGDDQYSISLTATGYIRRETKKVFNDINWNYRNEIQLWEYNMGEKVPAIDLFEALEFAFRGGDVHGNRFYTGVIMKNVFQIDRSSSYPEVMINHEFPKNRMKHLGSLEPKEIIEMVTKKHMALLMVVNLENVHLKDPFEPDPYIAYAKTKGERTRVSWDNGRITKVHGWIQIAITDVDLRIILDQYEFTGFYCVDCWGTVYGKLPDPLRRLIIDKYRAKTQYKGVEGYEAIYLASKEMLNSIYGMCCENPCRISIKYDSKKEDPFYEDVPYNIEMSEEEYEKVKREYRSKLLNERNRKRFLPYTWAIWVTSWSRYELARGMRIIKKASSPECAGDGSVLLYCDTDSLKYFVDSGKEPDFSEYNDEKIRLAKENDSIAYDPEGNPHYLGCWEDDGKADRFIQWGAKKYAYEKNGKLTLTLSGVPKKKGSYELMQKGGLEAFNLNMVFEDAGLDIKYNDHVDTWVEVNGEAIHITPNCYLYTSTYRMGIADNYAEACEIAKEMLTEHKLGDIIGL